jgi:hypothetical protein
MQNPSELSGPSLKRFNALEAQASAELLKQLNACWREIVLGGGGLPRESYRRFFPAFLQYGGALFDAYAKELLRVSLSAGEYSDILTSGLTTQIVFRIAPPLEHVDSMGEWFTFVSHSWRVFDHPLHSQLSGGRVAHSLRDPYRWAEFIDCLNKELIRRVPDLMAQKYARVSTERRSVAPITNGVSGFKAAEGTIVDRRKRLLNEYKTATGKPSDKSIYEARNSGIYKPQFYEWRDGRLPDDSATTKNFERFLSEKKPPIPRKPRA